MNRKNIYISIFFLLTLVGFSGCKDDMMTEITKLDVDRAFSPTGLTASVVNKTGVKLTWNAVNNAKTYTIEVFENADFSGTASKTIKDINFLQVPYTITGLSGDTQYSIRVKAVGDGVDDSKWISATVKTDSEQIFQTVNPAKLTSNSVVLNWPAGQTATTITLAPGNITHTVTAAEITAGEATITGLTGETLYTAKLLNGTKVRGTITFTTLLDLGGALPVYPTDNLATLIANANTGDVFALFPGTYTINADLTIPKSISIKGARPTDKPKIVGAAFKIRGAAGLELKDLVLDGTGSIAAQTIIYDEALPASTYGALSVKDSEIKNYVKGILYINVAALAESITYSGNLIHDISCTGAGFIDFRTGFAKTFLFENNTVYNIIEDGSRDLFRMDAASSFTSTTSVITIRTNTFYNALNRAAGRYLYIRIASNQINFTKNIIAESLNYYTNQAATTLTSVSGNNYYNAPNFTASATSGAKNDTGTFTTLNPGFAAPTTGNFTISESTLKANGIGDPRWR
ncbi:DUF4957 domain-containing protein [Pedobacter boryungensis]|uniref:Fibronectin type III domain-containing protein n=1 Tax=Pedobacter boryungensis TaxID=869962 RepID=A0ABX2D955_9SPHI|nr:DUF4957 domain-containing protein [Pedobacter boryungensis]NQX30510.1 fibronectin type III domain-containing protein [Pedobacter boryungensis]